MDLGVRWLMAWSVLLVALACSSSEDTSTAGPDGSNGGASGSAGAAAGGATGGTSTTGVCVAGSDCSGCDTCMSWCECLAPTSVDTCVENCNGASVDGGTAGSAGTGGSPGLVACGGVSCDVSKQECCYASGGANAGQCKSQGSTCYGTLVRCDAAEDCGNGQICCARLANNGQAFTQLTCRDHCASNEVEVCGADPSVCATGSCKPSAIFPVVNVCQ